MGSPKTRREERSNVLDRKQTERPGLYRVVLHNDDFTTMEFVVHVLREQFVKSETEAVAIALEVHIKGRGVCGVFPKDIAETKAADVVAEAKESGMPLLCTAEPVP